jgi:NAD(P)-dependent dehydrogenase (short-subunit alcohol dehydrogenase family)
MRLLEGRTAVVTGATKGIGRGIAVELAREGARVLVAHRGGAGASQAAGDEQETARLIREAGGTAPVFVRADLAREEDAARLAEEARRAFGRVDCWVNNVGKHDVTPALAQSAESWERLYRVNTTSAFVGCREAAKLMIPAGGGTIINIASKMGMAGSSGNACYCSAKAAVIMLTRCLAAEWASSGVRVNVIAPGITLTDPTYAVVDGKPALEAALHYRVPMGRFAQSSEMGKVAVFLASDLSSYVTGAVIACDGGWTAHGDFSGIPPEHLENWTKEFPRLKPD